MDADPCPRFVAGSADRFTLETEPQTEWWVRLLIDGLPGGWLLVDGKSVREGGRTFDVG